MQKLYAKRVVISFVMVLLMMSSTLFLPLDNLVASAKNKTVTIKIGQKKKLIVKKFQKKKNVKWNSSNKKIVTVSSKGIIKGKKAGKATIKATWKKQKQIFKVTVKKKSTPKKVTATQKAMTTETTSTASASKAPSVTETKKPNTTTTPSATTVTATPSTTAVATVTPTPTIDPNEGLGEVRMNAQITKDKDGSSAVKVNDDGTSTMKIPSGYSNLCIPISDQETNDLSVYSKMIINFTTTAQFRCSIFDNKNNNLKKATVEGKEWSQWEYLGGNGYSGKLEIDITSYDREKASYIVFSNGDGLSIQISSIEFVGDTRMIFNAQHTTQMDSGNPVAELSTDAGVTTIHYLANTATVMLPLGEKNTYNMSQYYELDMDVKTQEEVYVALFSRTSVNILPGEAESNQWWKVPKDQDGNISFSLTSITDEKLTDVAYIGIHIESNEAKPVVVRDIYFAGNAEKQKTEGNPIPNYLTVDCSSAIREATHCGSGALYGVTESIPTDIDEFVAPLNPCMYTQPALAGAGNQHTEGGAIESAERLANTTGTVTIRLADICPSWPYTFPGLTKWYESIDEVIEKKKASTANNIYGYEIWNEPSGTWTDKTLSFEEFWKDTYNYLREKDPDEKIIGPSYAWFDKTSLQTFLQYCIDNECLPDIMCWHELTNVGNTAKNIKEYRALEKELGMTGLPITINEYCDGIREREGAPGPSAAYLAKFERYKIDSACISWWFSQYPGLLGSLITPKYEKGAGWYFYKWYGEMTGDMLQVTPPNENSKYVDGLASLDSNTKTISYLFGGDTDGIVESTFENLPSWVTQDSQITVEKVDWESRLTASSGPVDITDEASITWKDGKIVVSVSDCVDTSGYRVLIKN